MENRGKYAFLNDKRKYLIVVVLFVLIAFCFYFNYAYRAHEDVLVREQAWEKQQDVNLIAGIVDNLVALDKSAGSGYGYEDMLRFVVQFIEENYKSTFAQVFDDRLMPLTSLSPGVGGGQKHNPLDFPEFVDAVSGNESGSLVYWYETEQAGGRYIHMYFRWVPTGAGHASRYLVAVGVSKYTVNESIDRKVVYGAAALVLVSAAVMFPVVALLGTLGHIYDQRQGDKWRGRAGGDGSA